MGHRSTPLRLVLALGATTMTAGCAAAVPAEDLSTSVTDHLRSTGIATAGVTCPDSLEGSIGASVTCAFTVDGQPVDVVVSVSAVEGDVVRFAVTTRAQPVPEDLLEQRLAAEVTSRTGHASPDVDCPGELAPTVGASVLCGLGDGERSVRVSVTRVDGGLVEYSVVVT